MNAAVMFAGSRSGSRDGSMSGDWDGSWSMCDNVFINIVQLTEDTKMNDISMSDFFKMMEMFNGKSEDQSTFKVGERWVFRSVTHYNVGTITKVDSNFITLEQALWVANTGEYDDFLVDGKIERYKAYPGKVVINLGALCDAAPFDHDLPK